MSSESALSHGKEIHLRIFLKMDNLPETVAASAVEAVENFVEVVDNFPYLNLYPLLWKLILTGERCRKALEIHGLMERKRMTFAGDIQNV